MQTKNNFEKLPKEIINSIVNFITEDMISLGRWAQINKFFKSFLGAKFNDKNFFNKIIADYLTMFANLDVTQSLEKMTNTELRDLTILLQVVTHAVKLPNIPEVVDRLFTYAAMNHDDRDINFLINMLVAMVYIHPELQFTGQEQYFSKGFTCAQTCANLDPENADISFTLAAYWKCLYQMNEMKRKDLFKQTYLQKTEEKSPFTHPDNNPVIKEIMVLNMGLNQAQKLCENYLNTALQKVDERLALYYKTSADFFVLAHPLCRLFVERLARCLKTNELEFDSLANLSSRKIEVFNTSRGRKLFSDKNNFLKAVNMTDEEFLNYLNNVTPVSAATTKNYITIDLPNNKRFKASI